MDEKLNVKMFDDVELDARAMLKALSDLEYTSNRRRNNSRLEDNFYVHRESRLLVNALTALIQRVQEIVDVARKEFPLLKETKKEGETS